MVHTVVTLNGCNRLSLHGSLYTYVPTGHCQPASCPHTVWLCVQSAPCTCLPDPGTRGNALLQQHTPPPAPARVSVAPLQVAQEGGVLHIDMQADEDEWMVDIGTLNSFCPRLHTAEIALSHRVSSMAAAENVKLLFVFQDLRKLELR